MNVLTSILFLFAGIGVVNGLLVASFLLFKKSSSLEFKYLGALLVALSLRIGKSIYYYFDDSADKLILQIGLSACLFIGPFFYKYLSSKEGIQSIDKVGFSLLAAGILIVGVVFPYRLYPEIWNSYIVLSIYAIWVIFVLLGLFYSRSHIETTFKSLGIRGLMKDQKFIVLVAVLFITATYQCAIFISGFTYIWGSIVFTIFFYYMMANSILQVGRKDSKKLEQKPLHNGDRLLLRVNGIMEEKRLFLNAKLKLDELANEVNLDRNTLSRLLNEVYPHGFSRYVNEFRIKAAKQLITNRPELSLEGIGYEAGFNSKSSFFAAFKKISSKTPAQFKKTLQTA